MNCNYCKNWGKCPLATIINDTEFRKSFNIFYVYGVECKYFVPDYITLAQYKERTGHDYPPYGVVKVFCEDMEGYPYNYLDIYGTDGRRRHNTNVIGIYCAFGDIVPPNDFLSKDD